MPALTPEDRERLLVVLPTPCGECGTRPYRDYCRQCDEFAFVCAPDCLHNTDAAHAGHRRYPRTAAAVGGASGPAAGAPGVG